MNAGSRQMSKRLNFEIGRPVSAGMTRGKSGLSPAGSWLAFSVTPLNWQSIWLLSEDNGSPTASKTASSREKQRGKELTSDIQGKIVFRQQPSERSTGGNPSFDEKDALGSLEYSPGCSGEGHWLPECYQIEIHLPEAEFVQLQRLFVGGNLPMSITVWTSGVEFGIAPDASEKIWDVKNKPYLEIDGFSVGFSVEPPRLLVGPAKTEVEEEEVALKKEESTRNAIVETRRDVQLLCSQVAEIRAALLQGRKRLNLLVGIVGIIALEIVFYVQHHS